MARGDDADRFFRELRTAGLSRPAVEALVRRFEALEAGSSSGSNAVSTRSQYRHISDANVVNGSSLQWVEASYGQQDHLLDLTDPFNPTVVEAGVYAVSAMVSCENDLAGHAFAIQLDMDVNGDDPLISAARTTDAVGSTAPWLPVALAYYCPAGALLTMTVAHDIGPTAQFDFRAFVQRLS